MPRKEKKYYFIYKITNMLSGRYYIGMHSTNNMDDGYLGSGNRLRLAIRKHGKLNFKREILEFCESSEELKKREKEIITLDEIAKDDCMNLVVGGEGGWDVNTHNNAFKNKLKNDLEFRTAFTTKQRKNSKKAMSEGKMKPINETYSWVGKNHSEESKKKMSKIFKGARTGETNSQYGTSWVTKEFINKKIKKEELDLYLNDGWVKGRFTHIKGELVKNCKLTNNDVLKIKQLLYENELSQSKIGKMFNVCQETISKIKRGLTHKDI